MSKIFIAVLVFLSCGATQAAYVYSSLFLVLNNGNMTSQVMKQYKEVQEKSGKHFSTELTGFLFSFAEVTEFSFSEQPEGPSVKYIFSKMVDTGNPDETCWAHLHLEISQTVNHQLINSSATLDCTNNLED